MSHWAHLRSADDPLLDVNMAVARDAYSELQNGSLETCDITPTLSILFFVIGWGLK